jgi:RNA recognition motif-containing protein
MPKLYIGNLAYSTTTEDLEALFSRVGKVESAAVVADKFSGRSKGFGFVEMADSNEAANAIESLNDSEFQGRRIKVAEAHASEQRGPGSGGGRGGRPGGGGRGGERRW